MKKPSKKKSDSKALTAKVDLDPDAWPKFEHLIKSAAKMGHKPHVPPKPTKPKGHKS